jgi:integrase
MPKKAKTYPGHLQERGGAYRWIYKADGEAHSMTFQNTAGLSPREFRRACEERAKKEAEKIDGTARRVRAGLPGATRVLSLFDQYEADELPHLAERTQMAYRRILRAAREYFGQKLGNPDVREIHRPHVRAYLTWRRDGRMRGEAPLSEVTLSKDMAVLSAVFSFGELELQVMDRNPARQRRKRRGKAGPLLKRTPYILTPAELEGLLRECEYNPVLWTYALLLAETGVRDDSEGLFLQWPDLHFERDTLRIVSYRDGHATKGGKSRDVPMSPRLKEALQRHAAAFRLATYAPPNPERVPAFAAALARFTGTPRERAASLLLPLHLGSMNPGALRLRASRRLRRLPSEERNQVAREALEIYREAAHLLRDFPGERSPWVFHHTAPNADGKPGERIRRMSHGVMGAARRAGIPAGRAGFVPHDLRHRRASLWVAEGLPLPQVQEWLGHAAISTTMIYVHMAADMRERLFGTESTPAPSLGPEHGQRRRPADLARGGARRAL